MSQKACLRFAGSTRRALVIRMTKASISVITHVACMPYPHALPARPQKADPIYINHPLLQAIVQMSNVFANSAQPASTPKSRGNACTNFVRFVISADTTARRHKSMNTNTILEGAARCYFVARVSIW